MSKKEDIIKATIDIIANEGVTSATIASILKKAKTGYGTLYNYFEDKEQLYFAVYKHIVVRLSEYMSRHIDLDATPLVQLMTMMSKYIDYAFENIEEYYTFEAFLSMSEMCQVTTSKESELMDARFQELIQACEDSGIIRKREGYYNQKMILGIMSVFIKYHHDLSNTVTSSMKDDLIMSCINAIK